MLLRIPPLVHATDDGFVTGLVLLDLSSAFHTVDYTILLSTLTHRHAVRDTALSWFQTYFDHRCQTVSSLMARLMTSSWTAVFLWVQCYSVIEFFNTNCNSVLRLISRSIVEFLRAKAGTAIARLSHRSSVFLSVYPSIRLSITWVDQSKMMQATIFTVGCVEDSSFRNCKAFP